MDYLVQEGYDSNDDARGDNITEIDQVSDELLNDCEKGLQAGA